ncbi:Origin of replication complex subunit 5 [Citrus sinensis]|uniref:Origin of replication complex subunit 5 n=1 Tax=Citrus sinensis TaxID=2711 RepID=A0ACB8MPF9_CITSI|nr:Origin of replication complex subunit 5 [Citrus sinensis]KAH9787818.1 Origin of replication complex subunit 5 [Citrus sinensis]
MAREKEESMQVSRRATRSSTFSANNNGIELGKPNDSYIPTLGDLVFGQEPISLDDLLSRFPGRRVQILELLRLLGTLNSSMPPLFVYGSASTGKTSIIIQVFRHLSRPFVYTSCLSCYSPRILFESILNQLLLHKKNAFNGYSSAKRCEKPSDFVIFVREALINVIDSLKENAEKTSTSKLKGQVNGKMIYLIFDNFELVREWDKSSSILPFLFGLSDILKMPEVGMIFISSTSPDTIVLRPFCRITKRVDELSTAFSLLFKRYCEPLSDLGVLPNGEMKRRLFSHLQPHIAPSLNEIFRVASQPCLECGVNQETRRKGGARKSVGSGDLDDIGFHMSTSAKYLLVSAFLASRNPATLDASLFDTTGVSDSRKRKRKASEKSLEQKEAAEQELLMKGPGTFSLERLLAIFQCITSVGEEEEGNDGLRVDEGSNALMSDILLQLTSLCNSNFIVKGGSCPLEGSTRYRSTLSEDLAIKVARSIKFPLSKYLYRR